MSSSPWQDLPAFQALWSRAVEVFQLMADAIGEREPADACMDAWSHGCLHACMESWDRQEGWGGEQGQHARMTTSACSFPACRLLGHVTCVRCNVLDVLCGADYTPGHNCWITLYVRVHWTPVQAVHSSRACVEFCTPCMPMYVCVPLPACNPA